MANPVLVEQVRGTRVECRFRGSFAVVDSEARLVASAGDIDTPVYPRSAYKMLQTLPLVETGAAGAFHLGDAELALACASHSGEPRHVETVRAWLGRIGLKDDDFECGAHRPRYEPARDAMIRADEEPVQAHNNCSGKHAGFLTVACYLGVPAKGYTQAAHPVQQRALAAIARLSGVTWDRLVPAIDGCSAPNYPLPLRAFALALARFADPSGLEPGLASAARRLTAAMRNEPFMVAGTERCCTALIEEARGRAVVKVGAAGVYAGILPEMGLGIAVKIDDGGLEASENAICALLERFGVIDGGAERVSAYYNAPIRNWRGIKTGHWQVVKEAFGLIGH